MKRKVALVLLLLIPLFIVSACSSNDSDQSSYDKSTEISTESADMDRAEGSFAERDSAVANDGDSNDDSAVEESESVGGESAEIDTTNRMIIHTAQLDIRVEDFKKTQLNIENKVGEYAGYVVESSVYGDDDQQVSGHMIVRIPEKHFQAFLNDTEDEAVKVLSRDVTGQDVTEQYVDLESRLKSKRVVEERLLTFLDEAEKTEDLLKISTDLATVQEEIEVIVGKMNYLENQAAYATIEISMHENRVIIPEIDNQDLNTWEKTKKQFAESMNFLLKAGSSITVFVIGNLPVIILLLVIGAVVYLIIKRRKKIE